MPGLRRDHFIDLSPFRASPAFTRMWIGSTLAGLGGQLTIVAIMRSPTKHDRRPTAVHQRISDVASPAALAHCRPRLESRRAH